MWKKYLDESPENNHTHPPGENFIKKKIKANELQLRGRVSDSQHTLLKIYASRPVSLTEGCNYYTTATWW